jgi:alpha-tubulin suppressor-like RCC1 family protein
VSVAGSDAHACAALATGAVQCWGADSSAQFGTGVQNFGGAYNTPVATAALPTAATKVAAGYSHSCALLADSTIACWGSNEYGQAGNLVNLAPQVVSGAP